MQRLGSSDGGRGGEVRRVICLPAVKDHVAVLAVHCFVIGRVLLVAGIKTRHCGRM